MDINPYIYIKNDALILIPVLYFIGLFLRQTPKDLIHLTVSRLNEPKINRLKKDSDEESDAISNDHP